MTEIYKEWPDPERICSYCVMDTTDPLITFDEQGACNHCSKARQAIESLRESMGGQAEQRLVDAIKADGKGKDYDAIVGISGGVDSSYLCLWASRHKLRLLVIHIDTGWNSELAVRNIELLCSKLNYELHTHVINWREMSDLQLAFFRSGVPNQDVPQDHVINAGMYNFTSGEEVKWALSGSNMACESILPASWGYDALDLRHIMDIHIRFGTRSISSLPKMGYFRNGVINQLLKGVRIAKPLNTIKYSLQLAISELEREVGWKYYGGKHYESRFTKFFQGYYLPNKWGYDKRKAHLSSRICSGELNREQALLELSVDPRDEFNLDNELRYFSSKLQRSPGEIAEILFKTPNITHDAYSMTPDSIKRIYRLGSAVRRKLLG